MTTRARANLTAAVWGQTLLLALLALCCADEARAAQPPLPSARAMNAPPPPPERSAAQWLERLQRASRVPSYAGTFVVSSGVGGMASAHIWHVRDGNMQLERVETLSGIPRAIFRRDDVVVTFLPRSRTVRTESDDYGTTAPNRFAVGAIGSTAAFYAARQVGDGRVAGFEADIVQLTPRDGLRFGYRIWSEKRTGLALKTQTLDRAERVLEQAAFSELQFGAPINAAALRRMMERRQGYTVQKSGRLRTSAEAEGWRMKTPIAGFMPHGFYRRARALENGPAAQWIFSDGLATVSLFIEPFNAERHAREGAAVIGATHTLARRRSLAGADWWITAVGEVPARTLQAFIDSLERRT
jgi:sigma-E factor negative regulatory protein RseB